MSIIFCGPKEPSVHDQAVLARFQFALRRPTREGVRLEMLRQMAEEGDGEVRDVLASHGLLGRREDEDAPPDLPEGRA